MINNFAAAAFVGAEHPAGVVFETRHPRRPSRPPAQWLLMRLLDSSNGGQGLRVYIGRRRRIVSVWSVWACRQRQPLDRGSPLKRHSARSQLPRRFPLVIVMGKPTAIAAIAAGVSRKRILFGQVGGALAVLHERLLQGAHGAESPATAAVALILIGVQPPLSPD